MKRFFGGVLLALVLVSNLAAAPAQADTNNFRITNFEADYYLDRDAENRSTLRTVEKITAEFPQEDQNHGIERAIPTSYDGHSTSLKIVSVTDESGSEREYSTSDSNGNEVLRIGNGDTFVHGMHTYVITYDQRDVTKSFGNKDEFYWDVNGTEWRQPFDALSARIHLSEALAKSLNGDASCYQGAAGSTELCTLSSSGSTLSTQVAALDAGQNVTFAIGFKPGTFAGYQQSLGEKLLQLWAISLIVTSIIGLGLIIWLSIRYSNWSNRKKELGSIVPEYIPPSDASVLVSEHISEGARAGLTAQIIDLSVRHYLKLYQTQEKSTFKSAEYELEIVKSIDDLRAEEKEFIATIFGEGNTAVGSRFEMKKLKGDYGLSSKLHKNTVQTTKRIRTEYELRGKNEAQSGWFKRAAIILLIAGLFTLSPLVLVAAITAAICASYLYPLTDKGLALRRYLAGLKLYIGVAEEERLKMLQSPEGVDKVGISSADNPSQLVTLYERVLPYAVLFGQEKEWNNQLGKYYEQSNTNPDWYTGNAAFNAAVFATAMNDFSTTTNSYGASTSSSSSGSGGGGSSGGGGGGGGGGGW